MIPRLARPPDLRDVAAGAEGPLARAVEDHELDAGIRAPSVERVLDGEADVVGQRVQCLGAVQRDPARRPFLPDDDLVHQPRSASRVRAVIIRMTSLVPSRIWCTRRSRTIFSIP
jgi:hypothetical protein